MKSRVIRYSLNIVFMLLLLVLAGVFLSSCCSPSKRVIALNYLNDDELLNVKSERLARDYNETTDIEITVPSGFEIGEIPITVDTGATLNYEVILSDPTVDEGYEYTIERTIKFTLPNPARNYAVNVNLENVKRKRIDISLDSALYGSVHNSERGAAGDDIRMYFVTIDPNVTGNFMRLTPEDIIRQENFKLNDTLPNTYSGYFEYNECVMLVYQKVYGGREIPSIYSTINHFTPYNRILSKNGIDYVRYDVAKRGNTYYTYSLNSDTRLFYLGYVQESFTLYSDVPNYTASVDLGIEMEKNSFYLMTNLVDRNSDFMSIDVYTSVNKSYVSSNTNLDRVSGVVVEKIPEDVVVRNKYSAYSMYIGDDKASDPLLDYESRNALHDDLYIRISSIYDLGTFEYFLYSCEKPQNTAALTSKLGEGVVSSKGEYFIKIDSDMVQDYLVNLTLHDGDYVYPYKSGSAIFYIRFKSSNYFSSNAMGYLGYSNDSATWHPVTSIRTEFNIQAGSADEALLIDYFDYSFEFYIDEDGDGEDLDYGFIDYHKDNFSTATITYFDTSKLYVFDPERAISPAEPNPDNYTHYSFKNTLYLNIHAPEYIGSMYPVIKTIAFSGDNVRVEDRLQSYMNVDFDYASTHDGVFSIPIYLGNRYMGDQYLVSVTLQLTAAITSSNAIDFSTAELPLNSGDGIYVTNNPNFTSYADFTFINYANQDNPGRLTLGFSTDLYYFGIPSQLNSISVHLYPNDSGSRISVSEVLCDILGRPVQLYINGIRYDVMVMYQEYRIFESIEGDFSAY